MEELKTVEKKKPNKLVRIGTGIAALGGAMIFCALNVLPDSPEDTAKIDILESQASELEESLNADQKAYLGALDEEAIFIPNTPKRGFLYIPGPTQAELDELAAKIDVDETLEISDKTDDLHAEAASEYERSLTAQDFALVAGVCMLGVSVSTIIAGVSYKDTLFGNSE
jgi:hypothetical protein